MKIKLSASILMLQIFCCQLVFAQTDHGAGNRLTPKRDFVENTLGKSAGPEFRSFPAVISGEMRAWLFNDKAVGKRSKSASGSLIMKQGGTNAPWSETIAAGFAGFMIAGNRIAIVQ